LLKALGHHSLHSILYRFQDIVVNDAKEVGEGFLQIAIGIVAGTGGHFIRFSIVATRIASVFFTRTNHGCFPKSYAFGGRILVPQRARLGYIPLALRSMASPSPAG